MYCYQFKSGDCHVLFCQSRLACYQVLVDITWLMSDCECCCTGANDTGVGEYVYINCV